MLTQPTVHFSACFESGVMLGAEALLSLNMEMELLSLRVSDFSMANGDVRQFLSSGNY